MAFYIGGTVVTGCAAQPLETFTTAGLNEATCTVTLAAGTYDVTAVYSGDDVNVASTSPDDSLVVSP